MSETIININGGNNQILPNATEAVQNFYGCQLGKDTNAEDCSCDNLSPDALHLQPYISNVENLRHYVARLSECQSATELAQLIVAIKDREPKITEEADGEGEVHQTAAALGSQRCQRRDH